MVDVVPGSGVHPAGVLEVSERIEHDIDALAQGLLSLSPAGACIVERRDGARHGQIDLIEVGFVSTH